MAIYRVMSMLRRVIRSWHKLKGSRTEYAIAILEEELACLPQLDQLTQRSAIADGLRKLMDPPAWLGAVGEPDRVQQALERAVPEFIAEQLAIREVVIKRLRLKKGKDGWTGQYELTYAAPGGDPQTVMLFAQVILPGFAEPAPAGEGAPSAARTGASTCPSCTWRSRPSRPTRRCRRCRC